MKDQGVRMGREKILRGGRERERNEILNSKNSKGRHPAGWLPAVDRRRRSRPPG
jgi:hypothetical protein